jgi:hypothetical protein
MTKAKADDLEVESPEQERAEHGDQVNYLDQLQKAAERRGKNG